MLFFPALSIPIFSNFSNPFNLISSNQISEYAFDSIQRQLCQFFCCQMNRPPSQTKTPKNKKNQPKPLQPSPSLQPLPASPQSVERYLPMPSPQTKEDLQKVSESHLPTIYRKHEYGGKEFTEIHDLRTGVRATRSKAPIKYTLSDFNEVAQFGSFLVNVSTLNAETSYNKTEWRQLYKEGKLCKCQKSECLKNYCPCHQRGTYCTSECLCLSCKNKIKSEIHFQAHDSEERIRSREKIGRKESEECTKRLQQNDRGLTNVCACKRSKNCTKSYCGCYRLGINCSSECGCSNCKN